MSLSEEFWESKYKANDIGWDLGEVSPPLKAYFDQLTNKNIKILIPGGGNSYEAEYLHLLGFKHVYVVDFSETALKNIKNRVPSFPVSNLIQNNFFNLDLTFDLIIEQTFFCAIYPHLRPSYTEKVFNMLHKNGKVVGLLFNGTLNNSHPPFGGFKAEYIDHFKHHFNILIMDVATNSIFNRADKELFFKMEKKLRAV